MRALVASLILYTLQCFYARFTVASGGRTVKIKFYDDYKDKASVQKWTVWAKIGNPKRNLNLKSEKGYSVIEKYYVRSAAAVTGRLMSDRWSSSIQNKNKREYDFINLEYFLKLGFPHLHIGHNMALMKGRISIPCIIFKNLEIISGSHYFKWVTTPEADIRHVIVTSNNENETWCHFLRPGAPKPDEQFNSNIHSYQIWRLS